MMMRLSWRLIVPPAISYMMMWLCNITILISRRSWRHWWMMMMMMILLPYLYHTTPSTQSRHMCHLLWLCRL